MTNSKHRSPQGMGFDTLSLHAGQVPDPTTGARATPIYQSAAFVFPDSDAAAGLVLPRRLVWQARQCGGACVWLQGPPGRRVMHYVRRPLARHRARQGTPPRPSMATSSCAAEAVGFGVRLPNTAHRQRLRAQRISIGSHLRWNPEDAGGDLVDASVVATGSPY